MIRFAVFAALIASALPSLPSTLAAQQMPRLESKDGHFALLVEGKPFLMLGAQIHNSSSWAGSLPNAWQALEALHANTVEAPVYWEQMEAEPGKFDFSGVDLLLSGAREHHLKLVLLWFGTWKNGQAHYVPGWMKQNTRKYPREISAQGRVLDVMSPNAEANLDADKHAFAALMKHVREVDGEQHTVILVQVENESGSIGSVRDYSASAQKQFDASVPSSLTTALHRRAGSWSKVFGAEADESFAAYSTARYVNEVTKAGKVEYPLPMYCNVWLAYPVHALENRDRASAGQEYPSGGPQQPNIAIWKAAAPAIDALAPDYYSDDSAFFREVLTTYHRSDNPVLIPETGTGKSFGRYLFYALGSGAVGFAPFGIDRADPVLGEAVPSYLSENFALLKPISEQIAQLNFDGKLKTAVEEKGTARQLLHFGDIEAVASFGFPQRDGEVPPGTPDLQGRILIAQLAPLEFLVTGFDTSVSFRLQHTPASASANDEQLEILQAEEGEYVDSVWHRARIWNGDETDRGLQFKAGNRHVVRIRLHRIPLFDPSAQPHAGG